MMHFYFLFIVLLYYREMLDVRHEVTQMNTGP